MKVVADVNKFVAVVVILGVTLFIGSVGWMHVLCLAEHCLHCARQFTHTPAFVSIFTLSS